MDRLDEFIGCSQDVFHRNTASNHTFCTKENWQSAVIHLAQEMESLGFASPCSKEGDGGNSLDVIALINGAWDVLHQLRACKDTLALIDGQRKQLHSEVSHLNAFVDKQRDSLEAKNRLVQDSTEKERHLACRLQDEANNLKSSKDEVRRLLVFISQKEAQTHHELKRKDQDLATLRDRLNRTLSGKPGGGQEIGLEVVNALHKPLVDGKPRSRWKNDQDKGYLSKVVESLQRRETQLQAENGELRSILIQVVRHLQRLIVDDQEEEAAKWDHFVEILKLPVKTDRERTTKSIVKGFSQMVDKAISKTVKRADENLANTKSVPLDLREERDKLNQEREEFNAEKRAFLLSSLSSIHDVAYIDQDGPVWSLGNATVTLSSPSSNTPIGVSVGPNYSRTRPPSRPQSRSHSRNRSYGQPATAVRRPRPKSTAMDSEVRISSSNWQQLRQQQVGHTKSRCGSASPSTVHRLSPTRSAWQSLPRIQRTAPSTSVPKVGT